jgi:hypothetical protein
MPATIISFTVGQLIAAVILVAIVAILVYGATHPGTDYACPVCGKRLPMQVPQVHTCH